MLPREYQVRKGPASMSLLALQARGKVSEIINNAIVHYRDDLDLQNLIDFGQKEVSLAVRARAHAPPSRSWTCPVRVAGDPTAAEAAGPGLVGGSVVLSQGAGVPQDPFECCGVLHKQY